MAGGTGCDCVCSNVERKLLKINGKKRRPNWGSNPGP